ncbi:hypothetical protein CPB86DRAFT_878451 [Serendipita vermifera]|nr:hypothetical protein CPB86DRAFT_878451 [Serendipita vermifera]
MSSFSLDRTPIEIWEKIFHHVTRSPLLPFTEDGKLTADLVDNLLLFAAYCETYDAYRVRTQAVVERLRLVCRTWANLLAPKTNELLLTDWKGHLYPSIQFTFTTKLGYFTDRHCTCLRMECIYRTHRDRLGKYRWKGVGQIRDTRAFHERFPRLRILGCDEVDRFAKALGMVTNLQALQVFGIPDAPASDLLPLLDRLTHLDLSPIPIDSQLSHEKLVLPTLQYLSMQLKDPSGLSRGEVMGQWNFPSLRTLYIDGDVHEETEKETIHRFVMRHVKGLDGLGLVYTLRKDGWKSAAQAPAGLWDCVYPNLDVLGVNIQYLCEGGEIPWVRRDTRQDCKVCTIVVSGLEYAPLDGESGIACLLKEIGRIWGVKVFVCTKSWEAVRRGIFEIPRRNEHLHGPIVEIAQSLRHVIEMLDSEGMVMMDPFEVTLQQAYDYLVYPRGRVSAPMYR